MHLRSTGHCSKCSMFIPPNLHPNSVTLYNSGTAALKGSATGEKKNGHLTHHYGTLHLYEGEGMWYAVEQIRLRRLTDE